MYIQNKGEGTSEVLSQTLYVCYVIYMDNEMVKHILWDCSSVKDIWGACGKKIQKSIDEGTTFV